MSLDANCNICVPVCIACRLLKLSLHAYCTLGISNCERSHSNEVCFVRSNWGKTTASFKLQAFMEAAVGEDRLRTIQRDLAAFEAAKHVGTS